MSTAVKKKKPLSVTAAAAKQTKETQISAAASPALAGRRAAAWLTTWDKGSKKGRMCILQAFISLHAHSNSSVLESDLGDAAPLFFTRLTSWLRLTYKALYTGKKTDDAAAGGEAQAGADGEVPATPLLLLVHSITLFVRASSYMTQMIEVGVTAALTDALVSGTTALPFDAVAPPAPGEDAADPPPLPPPRYAQLHPEERRAVLLLLIFTANAGRVYREMVCDDAGLVQLLHSFQRECDASLAALFTELFVVLGQGNPRTASLIHTGLVRLILCRLEYERLRWVPAAAGEAPPFPPRHTVNVSDSRAEATQAEEVVLQCASSLRSLQLAKEAHHLSAAAAGAAIADLMPIVGLGRGAAAATAASNPVASPEEDAAAAEDPLVAEVPAADYLSALFFLTLHESSTRFRVEGCELLALAAKNMSLTQPVLNKCLDVLEDDVYAIEDRDDVEAIVRRQRRQLSCGRAATQVMLATPISPERRAAVLDLMALRGGHLTLLKYLRMSDGGDVAAVTDCCRALQLIVRAGEEEQRRRGQTADAGGGRSSSYTKMARAIQAVVGDSLYELMCCQDITEEESFTILRAARSANAAGGTAPNVY